MEKEVRVYLSPHEYETFLDHCDRRQRLASRIIAETSSRRGITADLQRKDFFVPDEPGVELAFVKLRETKDTTPDKNVLGGKTRISWVPWDLYKEVEQYCEDEGIEAEDEIFDIAAKWLGDQITFAAEATATATGIDDFRHITSHDFRAYYATNMVRRLGVDIEIVMEMGSWNSRKAIEPYLATPLPRDLQDELARAGVTQKDVPVPPRQDELGKVLARLDQIERALGLSEIVDVTELTKSDVRLLKNKMEEEEREAEQTDNSSKTSLNDFVNVVTPAGAAMFGTIVATKRTIARLHREWTACEATPTEPSAGLGAAAYALGLLLVFVPLVASTGTVLSPDVGAAALGGVLGTVSFNFDE